MIESPAVNLDDDILGVSENDLPEEVNRQLSIDPFRLDDELVNQPRRYASWAIRAAEAYVTADDAKRNLEVLHAVLYGEKRTLLSADGKKPTEAMVEAATITDFRYLTASREYSAARLESMVLQKVEHGMEMRMEALVNLSATQRRAMDR